MSYPILELIQLPNKVVVITGGNRGIGIEVVKKLLRCEMTIVMGEKWLEMPSKFNLYTKQKKEMLILRKM
jgi:short-subunit dehydrogenase involved in D-alanine esterification of teichoic acids